MKILILMLLVFCVNPSFAGSKLDAARALTKNIVKVKRESIDEVFKQIGIFDEFGKLVPDQRKEVQELLASQQKAMDWLMSPYSSWSDSYDRILGRAAAFGSGINNPSTDSGELLVKLMKEIWNRPGLDVAGGEEGRAANAVVGLFDKLAKITPADSSVDDMLITQLMVKVTRGSFDKEVYRALEEQNLLGRFTEIYKLMLFEYGDRLLKHITPTVTGFSEAQGGAYYLLKNRHFSVLKIEEGQSIVLSEIRHNLHPGLLKVTNFLDDPHVVLNWVYTFSKTGVRNQDSEALYDAISILLEREAAGELDDALAPMFEAAKSRWAPFEEILVETVERVSTGNRPAINMFGNRWPVY